MKTYSEILCFLLFSITFSSFGQKISETNFALGISKLSSSEFWHHWDGNPPTYLTFNATKSWYNNNHRISLRKELGLNLQYSSIGIGGGGLGGGSYSSGNITSLFADVSLLANIQINKRLAFCVGPEAELLLIGNTNVTNDWYYYSSPHPMSGSTHEHGINRDYFNQPAYGIKARLYESGITEKVTIGLAFSYLWTKSEDSNFYASNYTRISLCIGFTKQEKELPAEPQIEQLK